MLDYVLQHLLSVSCHYHCSIVFLHGNSGLYTSWNNYWEWEHGLLLMVSLSPFQYICWYLFVSCDLFLSCDLFFVKVCILETDFCVICWLNCRLFVFCFKFQQVWCLKLTLAGCRTCLLWCQYHCLCVCVYVCMCVCMLVCVCVCVHMHLCLHVCCIMTKLKCRYSCTHTRLCQSIGFIQQQQKWLPSSVSASDGCYLPLWDQRFRLIPEWVLIYNVDFWLKHVLSYSCMGIFYMICGTEAMVLLQYKRPFLNDLLDLNDVCLICTTLSLLYFEWNSGPLLGSFQS